MARVGFSRTARLAIFIAACASAASAQDATPATRLISGDFALLGSSLNLAETAGPRRKYAVVVGNSTYEHAPSLKNAVNDAQAVAGFLAQQGYQVTLAENLTKRGFERLFQRILFDVDRNTEVFLYYAGHGLQVGAENYLIPIDARLDNSVDLPFESVSLGSLVAVVGARARLQVIVLDSCRNNPFAGVKMLTSVGADLRETETGFASQAAPVNSLLVFSTSPGAVAFDGEGDNSPFALAFLESAVHPQPAKDVFEEVRRRVFTGTKGLQVPWDSSTLVEPVSIGTTETAPLVAGGTAETGGHVRSLRLLSNAAAPATATAATTADLTIDGTLGATLPVGEALVGNLGLGEQARIDLVAAPDNGQLLLAGNGATRSVPSFPMTGAQLRSLVFEYDKSDVQMAGGGAAAYASRFVINVNDTQKVAEVRLTPSACDLAAGDHLDPEGTGVARYANEIEPAPALAACQAAVAAEPGNARFHYELGRVLTALRRFDEARAEYDRARELGYIRASYAIGSAIVNQARETGGSGALRAPDEALAYFKEGVERGDPYAYYALGRQLLRFGDGDRVRLQGYDLLMRALEVGHTFAMNELGYFYLDDKGPYFDPERGLRYLRESAARGDIYGYNNLGLVYRNGLGGVAKDPAQALEWFTRAAEGGHPNGPGNVGQLYASGELGGRPDYAQAVRWFDQGLDRGDANAGAYGAYIILTQRSAGLPPDEAALRAGRAAALRDAAAVGRARQVLAALPQGAVDKAAQTIIAALGEPVTPDGDFGQQSRDAYARLAGRFDLGPVQDQPVERLVHLARMQWTTTPFRVDLY